MTTEHSTSRTERRARIGLAAGALVGILLAAAGVFAPSPSLAGRLGSDAIAWVNDKAISAEDFASRLQQAASDNRNELTDEDRARVVNQLIDEELLVQRGVEIGLADSDQTVRKAISAAMIQLIIATESSSEQPSEDDLRAFFEDHYGPHNLFLFEVIRDQVEAAYIQRAADEAVRDYIDWMWEEAEITISPEVPR